MTGSPAPSNDSLQIPLILATDLDGTFAAGSPAERARLQHLLDTRPDTLLIYVTGRSVAAASSLITEAGLPDPAILIADVGTTVVEGDSLRPVEAVQSWIMGRWPGGDLVRARLAGLAGIVEQEVRSPYRVSYAPVAAAQLAAASLPPEALPAELSGAGTFADTIAAARARLAGMPVDLLGSAGIYLDILPRGVNKGTTLRRVLRWLGSDEETVLVAGDSLNDLPLFELGYNGVVVGNGEPELIARVTGREHVYLADTRGAAGITEALGHFGWLSADKHDAAPVRGTDTIMRSNSGATGERTAKHRQEIENGK